MKPFNLEEALAGKKVITRDGQEVTQLHLFKNVILKHSLFGVLDNNILSWHKNTGRYNINIEYHDDDLFMASEKKEGWINIYNNKNGDRIVGTIFRTEQEAKNQIGMDIIAIVRIEWEE